MNKYEERLELAEILARVVEDREDRKFWKSEIQRLTRIISVLKYMERKGEKE